MALPDHTVQFPLNEQKPYKHAFCKSTRKQKEKKKKKKKLKIAGAPILYIS